MLRALLIVLGLLASTAQAQQTYYVATNGVDTPAGGSLAAPWATITYALDRVPDQSTILVRPGTYTGRIRIRGNFPVGVTVRSELPSQVERKAPHFCAKPAARTISLRPSSANRSLAVARSDSPM